MSSIKDRIAQLEQDKHNVKENSVFQEGKKPVSESSTLDNQSNSSDNTTSLDTSSSSTSTSESRRKISALFNPSMLSPGGFSSPQQKKRKAIDESGDGQAIFDSIKQGSSSVENDNDAGRPIQTFLKRPKTKKTMRRSLKRFDDDFSSDFGSSYGDSVHSDVSVTLSMKGEEVKVSDTSQSLQKENTPVNELPILEDCSESNDVVTPSDSRNETANAETTNDQTDINGVSVEGEDKVEDSNVNQCKLGAFEPTSKDDVSDIVSPEPCSDLIFSDSFNPNVSEVVLSASAVLSTSTPSFDDTLSEVALSEVVLSEVTLSEVALSEVALSNHFNNSLNLADDLFADVKPVHDTCVDSVADDFFSKTSTFQNNSSSRTNSNNSSNKQNSDLVVNVGDDPDIHSSHSQVRSRAHSRSHSVMSTLSRNSSVKSIQKTLATITSEERRILMATYVSHTEGDDDALDKSIRANILDDSVVITPMSPTSSLIFSGAQSTYTHRSNDSKNDLVLASNPIFDSDDSNIDDVPNEILESIEKNSSQSLPEKTEIKNHTSWFWWWLVPVAVGVIATGIRYTLSTNKK